MRHVFGMMLFSVMITQVVSYNILMMMTFASKSHKNAFDPIAEELVKRGHKVTVYSPIPEKKPTPGVDHVFLEHIAGIMSSRQTSFFQGVATDPAYLITLIKVLQQVCHATYHNETAISRLIKDPESSKYDILIIDGVFNEWLLALGHHFSIPTIVFFPAQILPFTRLAMDIPSPPYALNGISGGENTFIERLRSAVLMLCFMAIRKIMMFNEFDTSIRQVLPNTPSISVLEREISMVLANSHPSIHPSDPSMPYFQEVGCLHCKKAKPLSQELEDYMQSSGDAGVIYFSLGSVTKGSEMPQEMRDKVIRAFAKLSQKVLWKYENDIEGLPSNIRLTKWAPQQDILAHNQTRLFISHGGGLSTIEAVYHGCPVLGFPLSADQWGNMATAVKNGYAESLDWRDFTVEEFSEKINVMLSESRFQKNVDRLSSRLNDQPQEPTETAAYWIEYVIRHKGAQHLKSGARHLNVFQYFLLDVIAFLILVIVIILLVSFFLLRKCYRLVVKRRNNKLKSS